MPNDDQSTLLNTVQDEIIQSLDVHECLNIGRQTGAWKRDVYLASREYRKLSKRLWAIQQKYGKELDISYTLFKDKYWQYFKRFNMK